VTKSETIWTKMCNTLKFTSARRAIVIDYVVQVP
jgi:hypothetical protein